MESPLQKQENTMVKIGRIYSYGDSFVVGDGVAPDKTWVSVLAKMLNTQLINHAVNGGSNRLSYIKLLNDLSELELLRGICDDYQHKVLVLFNWTGTMRTCFYHKGSKEWQNVLIGHSSFDKELSNKIEQYYSYFYNDFEAQADYYMQQAAVSSILESRQIKYAFMNSFVEDYLDKMAFAEQYEKITRLIDPSKYIIPFGSSIYDEACLKRNMVCADGFHPSEEGHEYVAKLAFDYINETFK